jgi:hypothetical protein
LGPAYPGRKVDAGNRLHGWVSRWVLVGGLKFAEAIGDESEVV